LKGIKAEDPVRFVGSGKNLAFIAQLGLSIGLYTLIPTFVALISRKSRAQQAGLLDIPSTSFSPPLAAATVNPPIPITATKPLDRVSSLLQPSATLSVVAAPSPSSLLPLFTTSPAPYRSTLPSVARPDLLPLPSGGWRIPAANI
jgi:hypothetical protein